MFTLDSNPAPADNSRIVLDKDTADLADAIAILATADEIQCSSIGSFFNGVLFSASRDASKLKDKAYANELIREEENGDYTMSRADAEAVRSVLLSMRSYVEPRVRAYKEGKVREKAKASVENLVFRYNAAERSFIRLLGEEFLNEADKK